jgi:hypothetical protein
MQSRNNANFYLGMGFDFNEDNLLKQGYSMTSTPIPITGFFLLLDGTNFLLLDGTDLTLL